MDHPVTDKTIVVTGASSGIGRSTARALADRGAHVALVARSRDQLERVAEELGANAVAIPADVTDPAQVDELVERTLSRFGRIDALFANAGIYLPGDFAESDPLDVARLIDTNVTGVMRCVRAVLPHMIEQGSGDVLVTSSVSGHQAIHWEPVYSASKHAIQSFVHGVRRQVAPNGVRVGAVAPGMVANELWDITTAAQVDAHVAAGTALRSEDVAEIIAFMLSRPRHVAIRDLVVLPHNQDL